ncbi:MAG: DUF2634 domain-containing protein [Bariatricus sp.]
MDEEELETVNVEEFVDDEEEEYDTEYKRSMKWDPELGDFVRNSSHQVMECSGYESYAIWCFKIAMTERNACMAYPDEIGTEMEKAMENDDEETVESMTERTIIDAIMVNPRTEYVQDFDFSWNSDEMHVSFKVKGIGMDEFTVSI